MSDHDHRVDAALAEYLAACDAGQPPERAAFLAKYPDLTDSLVAFLDDHERMLAAADPEATVAPPHVAPAILHYVGDYELTEEIARGGMGVVYRARQVSVGRVVAVKMILTGPFADDADIRRFRAEAEAAANLDHTHILPIYEVGDHEGRPYFSMKLADGGSLASRIATLTAREAATLLAKVARAVHFAHQRGILHRDLKPANVLLDAAGEPLIADFGLAKRVEGDVGVTQTGAIVGTPSYMPPEQARGEKVISTAADVWSLGAILYECLTGRPPFREASVMDTLLAVMNQEPQPPTGEPDLCVIALKCLRKDPRERYASAEALADDLERWLRGEPILARPVGRFERAAKWVRRNPVGASLIATSCLAMLALVGLIVGAVYHAQLQTEYDAVEVARAGEARERMRAESERDRADQIGYHHSLFLARLALKDRSLQQARQRLEECKPSLLAWEWRYLNSQCRTELFSIPSRDLQTGVLPGSGPLVFSPDGSRLLTVPTCGLPGVGGVVRVYDAWTGQNVLELQAPGGLSCGAVFSPDGSFIASGGDKEWFLRLFDARTGKLVWEQKGVSNYPEFSPDGTRISAQAWDPAVGGRPEFDVKTGERLHSQVGMYSPDGSCLAVREKGVLRINDARTGKELWQHDAPDWTPATFSPNSSRLAMVQGDVVRMVEAHTGKEIFQHKVRVVPPDSSLRITFNPNGSHLVIHATSNKNRFSIPELGYTIHDSSTGRELIQLNSHPVFSPDSSRFAVENADGMRIYDARTAREVLYLKGKFGRPIFTPDGSRILAVGADGVRVADARTGQGILDLIGVTCPLVSPDSSRIAALIDNEVRVYDIRSNPESLLLIAPKVLNDDPLKANFRRWQTVFSPDGSRIAVRTTDDVRVFEARNGQMSRQIPTPGEPVIKPDFSPDGSSLATGGAVYDVQTGRKKFQLPGVGRMLFSPDGSRIAVYGEKRFQVCDAQTGKLLWEKVEFEAHPWCSTVFSKDSSRVATTSDGSNLRMYDAQTGKEIWNTEPPVHGFTDLTLTNMCTLSPVTSRLGAGNDSDMRMLDAETGKVLFHLEIPTGILSLSCPVFSPDGSRLAMSGRDVVLIYDAATGKKTHQLAAAEKTASGMSGLLQDIEHNPVYSPDGSRIAASFAGTIRIFDTRTGQETFLLEAPGGLAYPEFSPDGSQIAALCAEGVRVYNAPADVKAWQAERYKNAAEGNRSWHQTRVAESERAGHWFAVAFHLGRLLLDDPDNADLKKRRDEALGKHAEK